jgi:predicted metal-binding membrane protein
MPLTSGISAGSSPHGARASDARVAPALIAALVALAWLSLAGWSASPWQRWLDHGGWADTAWLAEICRSLPQGERIGPPLAYATAWLLMITAMMLPTTLPLLAIFRRIVGERHDAGALVAGLLAGYAVAWLGFGIVVYGIDVAVRELATSGWLLAHGWVVGAVVIGTAGAFQFSALKYRCLEQCHTPFAFVASRWHGRAPGREALRLGIDHGVFCIGCCWALMLCMFVVGTASVGWMIALAGVMAVEKNLPGGTRLRLPIGLGLIGAAGAVVVAHA